MYKTQVYKVFVQLCFQFLFFFKGTSESILDIFLSSPCSVHQPGTLQKWIWGTILCSWWAVFFYSLVSLLACFGNGILEVSEYVLHTEINAIFQVNNIPFVAKMNIWHDELKGCCCFEKDKGLLCFLRMWESLSVISQPALWCSDAV